MFYLFHLILSDLWTTGGSKTSSWIFIAITFVAFFYWLGELRKYKKTGNE